MKKFKLIIFFFLALQQVFAQVDTTRRDTAWADSPHRPYLLSILEADVLEGRSLPVTIPPNRENICFDKVMKIKSTFPGETAGGCVFLNTKTGLIANTPVKRGSIAECGINPEDDRFVLFILGLKGNTFNYFNAKKNGVLQHYVSTGNSENYQYQFSNAGEVVTLFRTPNKKTYLNGKVSAWEYKADGREERWYLFGKTSPVKLDMAPNKFLGNYAVGYQYTDQGLFIIMEINSPIYNSEITKLDDVNVCFNPVPFKFFEEENFTLRMASINRNREKVKRNQEKIKVDDCPGIQQQKYSFQLESLNRQEQQLILSRQGNVQQNTATQAAVVQLASYDDMIQEAIYDTELSICRQQRRMSQAVNGPSAKDQETVQCKYRQKARQLEAQRRILLVNTQYPNQPAKQLTEKQKILLEAMLGSCN